MDCADSLWYTQCVLLRGSMATGPAVIIGHMKQLGSSLPAQKIPELWKPDSKVGCNLQAVSRPPLTAKARTRSQASPCDIYGEQSGTVTDLSASAGSLPVSTSSPVLYVYSFSCFQHCTGLEINSIGK
jgi:hypothetical protein